MLHPLHRLLHHASSVDSEQLNPSMTVAITQVCFYFCLFAAVEHFKTAPIRM